MPVRKSNRWARDAPAAHDVCPTQPLASSCLTLCEPLIFCVRSRTRLRRSRCCVGRDYDPVKGQWYEDLEENEIFQVLSLDPDQELVEIQYENGDIEEIDLDTWRELDLEQTEQP